MAMCTQQEARNPETSPSDVTSCARLTVEILNWNLSACLVGSPNSKKVLQYPSHRILRYVHGTLNIDEKKPIAQFSWKLRDERFEPN